MFDALVSHENERERKLGMFDPPIEVKHGKYHDDDIELVQGKHVQIVGPGELTHFRVEKKTIEIAHKGDIVKFK